MNPAPMDLTPHEPERAEGPERESAREKFSRLMEPAADHVDMLEIMLTLSQIIEELEAALKARPSPYDATCELVVSEGGVAFDVVRGSGETVTSFDADTIRRAYQQIKR